MGKNRFTVADYTRARNTYAPSGRHVTARAEEEVRRTGKLDPLVDPSQYGVIRRSLLRFEETLDKLFRLTIGCSMPVETRLDTTGSMGGNVDRALLALPRSFGLCQAMLPGYDLHMATGIFGDRLDDFILCRPQFEMLPEKIVHQLTLMNPERGGWNNNAEDPQYGLFGAAYLTAAYINRIGLKGYDFTITDEPGNHMLDGRNLVRVFGPEVFAKVATNTGREFNDGNVPGTKMIARDLLDRAHAFVLQVDHYHHRPHTKAFWGDVFGPERVIMLPDIDLVPQVQAVIIGLTEGTLDLESAPHFLEQSEVGRDAVRDIMRAVSNIPLGAQRLLPNYGRQPKAGDLFESKDALWPVGHDDTYDSGIDDGINQAPPPETPQGHIDWL